MSFEIEIEPKIKKEIETNPNTKKIQVKNEDILPINQKNVEFNDTDFGKKFKRIEKFYYKKPKKINNLKKNYYLKKVNDLKKNDDFDHLKDLDDLKNFDNLKDFGDFNDLTDFDDLKLYDEVFFKQKNEEPEHGFVIKIEKNEDEPNKYTATVKTTDDEYFNLAKEKLDYLFKKGYQTIKKDDYIMKTNPFESENQRRFLWATHPDIAKKFARDSHTRKKEGGRKGKK